MSGCRWLSCPSALRFTRQLHSAQRKEKCILKLSFEGNWLKKKKNQFRQITERMKSTFSSWCASVGRCLNRISIKQVAFIIPQKQIEMIVGLRFKFKAAILYSFFRCSFFTSIWHLKFFCFPITWPVCIWWNPEMSFFYTFLIQINFVIKQKKLSQTLKNL